jgi:hypothetical protein
LKRHTGRKLHEEKTAKVERLPKAIYDPLPEAEFSDKIQTKILRVFLLVIHSHLYSFALRFLFLTTHATSYSFCKGERWKTG